MKTLLILLLTVLIAALFVVSCDQSDDRSGTAPDETGDQLNGVNDPPDTIYDPNDTIYDPNDTIYDPNDTIYDPNDTIYDPTDTTYAPYVTHAYPGGMGTEFTCEVSWGTPVLVSFSKPIDPSTVTPETFDVSGAEGTYEVCGNTVLFTPKYAFDGGVLIDVTVSKQILDFDGEGMQADYIFRFTTEVDPG